MQAISTGKLIELFSCWDEKNVNSGNPKLPVSWRFPSDMKPGRLWSVSSFFFSPSYFKSHKMEQAGIEGKQTDLGFATACGR